MANFSLKNIQLTASKVYISAFDPETAKASNMPPLTISTPNDNVDNVIAYIESNYQFTRMAWFKNVKITDLLENDISNEVDDCDIGEWSKTTDLIPQFTGDWLTTLDLEAINILLGLTTLHTPWTLVTGKTFTLDNGEWTAWVIYRLPQQHRNSNGQIIKPTTLTVTWSTSWLMTEGTDYDIVDNGFGEFGVLMATTSAEDIEVEYNYLPIASEYSGYLTGQKLQPFLIVKIVWCPDEDGLYDTWYIVKASMQWSLDTSFIASWEVPLSSITLRGAKWGFKALMRNRL